MCLLTNACRRVRESLHNEATQFMQEQRIRCLLEGAWFPVFGTGTGQGDNENNGQAGSWRFVRLSLTRRSLHYSSHAKKISPSPSTADMPLRIEVQNVSSVVSNTRAGPILTSRAGPAASDFALKDDSSMKTTNQANGGDSSLRAATVARSEKSTTSRGNTITQLTIHGSRRGNQEPVLLELHTPDTTQASEWLDGLLMLLDQQPITADTNKMIAMVADWSLKVRMLNLEWEDVDWEGQGQAEHLYNREGLDTNYWYDMGESKA